MNNCRVIEIVKPTHQCPVTNNWIVEVRILKDEDVEDSARLSYETEAEANEIQVGHKFKLV